jgi:hypothetical protein
MRIKLTSYHVLSMFPSKLIGFSLKRIRPMFRLSDCCQPDRQDTRRLRFSFFQQRCQIAGGLPLVFGWSRRNSMPAPLRGIPARIKRQSHQDAQESVAPLKRRSLFSDRGYMGSAPACQAIVVIFFGSQGSSRKRDVFWPVDKSGSERNGRRESENLNRHGLFRARILVQTHKSCCTAGIGTIVRAALDQDATP